MKSCPLPANWWKWEAAVALSDFLRRPRSLAVSHALEVQWNSQDTDGKGWVPHLLPCKSPQILKYWGAEAKDQIKSKYSCPWVHIGSPGDHACVQVVLIYYLEGRVRSCRFPGKKVHFLLPSLAPWLVWNSFFFAFVLFSPLRLTMLTSWCLHSSCSLNYLPSPDCSFLVLLKLQQEQGVVGALPFPHCIKKYIYIHTYTY